MPPEVPVAEATPQLDRRDEEVDDAREDVGVGKPGGGDVAMLEGGRVRERAGEEVRHVGGEPDAGEDEDDGDEEDDRHPGRGTAQRDTHVPKSMRRAAP